jgi:hypothetical protein
MDTGIIRTRTTETICYPGPTPTGKYILFRYVGDHISEEVTCIWTNSMGDALLFPPVDDICTFNIDFREVSEHRYQDTFDYETMRKNLVMMIHLRVMCETRSQAARRLMYVNKILSVASQSDISLELLMLCLYAGNEYTVVPNMVTPLHWCDNVVSFKILEQHPEKREESIGRALSVTKDNMGLTLGHCERDPHIISRYPVTEYQPRDVEVRHDIDTNTNICYLVCEIPALLETGICSHTGNKIGEMDMRILRDALKGHPNPEHCSPLREEVEKMFTKKPTVEELL